ncbi:hypothetical protein [Plantactinospora sp. BB1]|uniref:hypothetical protein n=1 Tax=Plantactinospora sp. BB1 TaxID=2071627 RepID=UPI000D17E069|nr:hypothetical protein [Plantactinospora sp. BB1]AVT39701.1 hypothetical protein C6W10_28305 [Plantactinospora sp. BB1]
MRYYKFLTAGRSGPFSRQTWSTGWRSEPAIVPCRQGLHVCRVTDLPYWIHDELWEVEVDGPVLELERQVVAGRARLRAQVDGWNAQARREFVRACLARIAGHAAQECGAALDDGPLAAAAERLAEDGPVDLAELAALALDRQERAALRGSSAAARNCGYLADAIEMMESYPVAALGYVAARAAEARTPTVGVDRYQVEREWQVRWLSDRLELPTG